MILFKKSADLAKWLDDQRELGRRVGFVPTMGALHAGHLSLIELCRKTNRVTVCSIFINPTQFNDPKDFEKYPVTLDEDISMLERAGCSVLFLPSVKEIYPQGLVQAERYPLGRLETILEGKFRPGHYQGVCMVVERLLSIVKPGQLYLGQKDYQQCMVIAQLLKIMQMDKEIEIVIGPTLRESGGLAMSSRNRRLSENERETARFIHKSLVDIKKGRSSSRPEFLKTTAVQSLSRAGFKVDYVEIADALDLSPVVDWKDGQKTVALVAAYLGDVRLIDNLLLD